MNPYKIIIPALTGTTAMTIFSYLASEESIENLREPDNLRKLLVRATPLNTTEARALGWIIHYLAGIAFVSAYEIIYKKKKTAVSLPEAFATGAISGVAGILIWHATLNVHPNPPSIDIKKYYGHLLIAHVIFGVVALKVRNQLDGTGFFNTPGITKKK